MCLPWSFLMHFLHCHFDELLLHFHIDTRLRLIEKKLKLKSLDDIRNLTSGVHIFARVRGLCHVLYHIPVSREFFELLSGFDIPVIKCSKTIRKVLAAQYGIPYLKV